MVPTALLLPLLVGQVIHVDASASGANDGSSWADAFTDLQSALAAAGSTGEIWVAAGTYKPSASGVRTAAFTLTWSQRAYGGFAGTELSLADRAGLFDQTILSGDLNGDDLPGFMNVSDNSLHVVDLRGGVLDGFTITSGNAEDLWGGGGALLNSLIAPPTVANCVFRANRADYEGGAIAMIFGDSTIVRRCTFLGNRAEGSGGAVDTWYVDVPPRFESCRFLGNSARLEGGALRAYFWVDLSGCEFSGNSVDGTPMSGGGALATNTGRMLNCTFSDNRAVGSGLGGGGILANAAMIRNCVLWGNVDDDGTSESSQVRMPSGQTFGYVDHSCVQGWTGAIDDGLGNLYGDPLFLDPDGADGISGTLDDDLRLGFASPCVDTGGVPMPDVPMPDEDLGGSPRLVDALGCDGGGVLDIGAHERQTIDGTTSYCPQPPTSLGIPAEISAPCVVGVAGGELPLRVGPVPSRTGILFCGKDTASNPLGVDTLCVGGRVHRLPRPVRSGQFLGLVLDLADPHAAALVPGSTWHFQALFRDAGGRRLSDATTITFRD